MPHNYQAIIHSVMRTCVADHHGFLLSRERLHCNLFINQWPSMRHDYLELFMLVMRICVADQRGFLLSLKRVQLLYYWPSMRHDYQEVIHSCVTERAECDALQRMQRFLHPLPCRLTAARIFQWAMWICCSS